MSGSNHFQLDIADRIQQFFKFFDVVIERRFNRDGIFDTHRTEKRNDCQKQLIAEGCKHNAEGT